MMSQEEWKSFLKFSRKCPNVRPTRGGAFCDTGGTTGYCDPYGCPKWKK